MTAPTVVDGPVSSCCGAGLRVTRVVSDLIGYDATELAPTEDGVEPTLYVDNNRHLECLDSEGYEVTCTQCGQELQIEVEEL